MGNRALRAVFDKYRHHPQFLGLKITGPNPAGAVDDTLLHVAARLGALDDMKSLIAAGADVNCRGDLGNTPLHSAAMKGQIQALELLINCGADPSIKNEFGQTASEVAALGGHTTIVKLLDGHGGTAS